jgi:GNAT superfamily N-acetyltransferase
MTDTLDLARDLGNGLALRRATPDDVPAVADFISRGFAMPGTERFAPLAPYITELTMGRHPTTRVGDLLYVADQGRPVAALVLIPQAWELDGVRFDVGRIETVVTEKAYRGRGLQRALFAAAHQLSASYGHAVQAITGIFWFYRQFGYEYAVDLGGSRYVPVALVPDLKAGESDPFALRPATEADVPVIMRLYEQARAGKLLSAPRDETWLVHGRSEATSDAWLYHMIVDAVGHSVGYLSVPGALEDPFLPVYELALEEGANWRTVMLPVLRALKAHAAARLTVEATPRAIQRLAFMLGRENPVYRAFPDLLVPGRRPYAWYVRVADLPAFVRRIAPVLERRVAASAMAGYDGELMLNFFRDGLRLRFEGGRLVDATGWTGWVDDDDKTSAYFPPLVFLQLLFGRCSYDELRLAYADVYCKDPSLPLLEALFPLQTSWVLPLP